MTDFKNTEYLKLRLVKTEEYKEALDALLVDGEFVVYTFKGVRDGVVFTNKRILAINVKGVTGKKIDYSSLPYKNIQAFSVETAGVNDLNSELQIWFAGLGMAKFLFTSRTDVYSISKIIADMVL